MVAGVMGCVAHVQPTWPYDKKAAALLALAFLAKAKDIVGKRPLNSQVSA